MQLLTIGFVRLKNWIYFLFFAREKICCYYCFLFALKEPPKETGSFQHPPESSMGYGGRKFDQGGSGGFRGPHGGPGGPKSLMEMNFNGGNGGGGNSPYRPRGPRPNNNQAGGWNQNRPQAGPGPGPRGNWQNGPPPRGWLLSVIFCKVGFLAYP